MFLASLSVLLAFYQGLAWAKDSWHWFLGVQLVCKVGAKALVDVLWCAEHLTDEDSIQSDSFLIAGVNHGRISIGSLK